MDVNQALPLLAGLSPVQFMRSHWQKTPLLVRQAIPGFKPFLSRAALFKLAASEQVESRLVVQNEHGWTLSQGPFTSRSLPPLSKAGWSLLVQGVDLHDQAAHRLLQQFRFVPDARLDDLMISYATPDGGVGPHFDSYDVFLFQASGRRRWRISQQKDLTLQEGAPLKILKNFEPQEEFVLEAGDMLYLPPRYAHDGVAVPAADGKPADCMTYSIGFRAPAERELAAELLHRIAEFQEEESAGAVEDESIGTQGAFVGQKHALPSTRSHLYCDPEQVATTAPAALPEGLAEFARLALTKALEDPKALHCALGEYLTEPKPSVWFDEAADDWQGRADGRDIMLAAPTRMMYDAHHVFINGESYLAEGDDARLMQALANQRSLGAAQLAVASDAALGLLGEWHAAGWLNASPRTDGLQPALT